MHEHVAYRIGWTASHENVDSALSEEHLRDLGNLDPLLVSVFQPSRNEDGQKGLHDGTVFGKSYFSCQMGNGILAQVRSCHDSLDYEMTAQHKRQQVHRTLKIIAWLTLHHSGLTKVFVHSFVLVLPLVHCWVGFACRRYCRGEKSPWAHHA
eukprot:5487247-Amphidinium_carterae.1